MRRIVLAAVAGGAAAFLWGAVSWMALPWHGHTLKTFKDEVAVATVLLKQAPEPGVYLLTPAHWQAPTPAQQKIPKGLMLFGSVRHEALDLPAYLLRGLLINIFAAGVLAWLLSRLPPMGFGARVRTVTLVALAAAAMTRLPDWNWWSVSTVFSATQAIDLLVTWALGGAAIAWVLGPRAAR